MVELFGIIMICALINSVKLVSVLFFSAGIGLLCAIDYISKNEIKVNKPVLLTLETASTILISLSLLNEVPVYNVFLVLTGICMFYCLYNLKNGNKISTILLLLVSCTFVSISFYRVLNIFSFIIFLIGLVSCFCSIYIKKPCRT